MMMPTRILLASLCTACSVPGSDAVPYDAELVITVVEPSGLEGTVDLDGEVIEVRSNTLDGVRTISVASVGGTSYAIWDVDLATNEIVGAFGGQEFGLLDTAETDGDPDHWRPIAESHAGAVVEAVSSAAASMVGAPGLEEVNGELEAIAALSDYLKHLAGTETELETTTCSHSTDFQIPEIDVSAANCIVVYYARTKANRCGTTSAYVRIYNSNGSSFAYASGASVGGSASASVMPLWAPYRVGSTITTRRRAKHWDSRGWVKWSPTLSVVCPARGVQL